MLKKNPGHHQNSLSSSLSDQSDQRHAHYRSADKINYSAFEQAFSSLYYPDNGHPAKPVRLIYGLLILKHLRNLSDESVVELKCLLSIILRLSGVYPVLSVQYN